MTGEAAFATIAPVTIREHFDLMSNRIKYGAVGGALVVVAAILWLYPDITKQQMIVPALVMGAVVGLAVGGIGRLVYRCPKCGAYMTMKGETPIRPDAATFWNRWSACPHCGVSLDEPWSKPDAVGQ